MKTIRFYLFAIIAFFNIAIANAENPFSYENADLGIWCYITVDMNNDSIEDGFYRYKINVPPEGVVGVQGPCMPQLQNNNGSTVELCFKKMQLVMEAECNESFTIDLVVNKDHYSVTEGNIPYHYTIIVDFAK